MAFLFAINLEGVFSNSFKFVTEKEEKSGKAEKPNKWRKEN